MNKENKKCNFEAKLVRKTFSSESFKIYAVDVDFDKYPDIKRNKYSNVTILGDLFELEYDVLYSIEAIEEEGKYGTQYKVETMKRDKPLTSDGVLNFLREIITPTQADALYNAHNDIIDIIMEDRINEVDLSKIKGIGEKIFQKIVNKVVENYCLIEIIAEYKGALDISLIKKLYSKYKSVDLIREKLEKQPYKTLCRLGRIGFIKADVIVIGLNNSNILYKGKDVKTSQDRMIACIDYVLQQNENNGHTRMSVNNIGLECRKLTPECMNHFIESIKMDGFVYKIANEDVYVAREDTYATEKYIADKILPLINSTINQYFYEPTRYEIVNGLSLSKEQHSALGMVANNSISILNGFAGSGKTATVSAIISMLKDLNKSYVMMSPTGKAAKVMSEYTGEVATTIHRALMITPDTDTVEDIVELNVDVVIVDEFSMCDVKLFSKLLASINFNKTKLLIVGDNAQLPSVSCGNLLHDFITSNIIPTTTLTKIFRYDDGGLMRVATDTRNCVQYLNGVNEKITRFGDDYLFLNVRQEECLQVMSKLYLDLLKKHSAEDITVLSAYNVNEFGTININKILQRLANKKTTNDISVKVIETTFYEDDIVLQTRNNYQAEVHESDPNYDLFPPNKENVKTTLIANGETGRILSIKKTALGFSIVIDFSGTIVEYKQSDLKDVQLGYAITTWKMQGGANKVILMLTPRAHTYVLNSNLLYVGLTRMKERFIHIGEVGTINRAVKIKENLDRNTWMQDLLSGC